MARLRLMPRKREFFDLFTQASANAREIARLLVELLEDWPASREKLHDIREAEHEGDRLTREVINLLNRTNFRPVPPAIDRVTGQAFGLLHSMFPIVPSIGATLEF